MRARTSLAGLSEPDALRRVEDRSSQGEHKWRDDSSADGRHRMKVVLGRLT